MCVQEFCYIRFSPPLCDIHNCVCVYLYMYIYLYAYTYIYIHMYTCTWMYMYVYIYIYIRTYIYEYTHNIHMYRLATHSTCVFTTSIQTGLLNSVSESILMFPAWNCRELLAEHVSVLRSANYISWEWVFSHTNESFLMLTSRV